MSQRFQFRIWHFIVLMIWLSLLLSVSVRQSRLATAAIFAGNAASFTCTATIMFWLRHLARQAQKFSFKSRILGRLLATLHWTSMPFYGVGILSAIWSVGFAEIYVNNSRQYYIWMVYLGVPVALLLCRRIPFGGNEQSRQD